jgi:hypothetical protein
MVFRPIYLKTILEGDRFHILSHDVLRFFLSFLKIQTTHTLYKRLFFVFLYLIRKKDLNIEVIFNRKRKFVLQKENHG